MTDHRRWNTAGDCEINDDLQAEGLPLPGDPPLPGKYGMPSGINAERYYAQLASRSNRKERPAAMTSSGPPTAAPVRTANSDSGNCRPTTALKMELREWTGSRRSSCGVRSRG
jgi:hypothetical protein